MSTDIFEYYQGEYSRKVNNAFDRMALHLSEPFRRELAKYKTGTFLMLEELVGRSALLSDHYRLDVAFNAITRFLDAFASLDSKVVDACGSADRLLLDNYFVLKQDTQVEDLLRGYFQAEQELLLRQLFTGTGNKKYATFELSYKEKSRFLWFVDSEGCADEFFIIQDIDISLSEKLERFKSKTTKALHICLGQIKRQRANGGRTGDPISNLRADREKLLRTLQSL